MPVIIAGEVAKQRDVVSLTWQLSAFSRILTSFVKINHSLLLL